jgi:hypothetical protein
LGEKSRDTALVEELVQDVFCSLVCPTDRRLQAYDPAVTTWGAYLAALGRERVARYHRERQRRKNQDLPLGDAEPAHPQAGVCLLKLRLGEALATLLPKRRIFAVQYLLGYKDQSQLGPWTQANIEKLTQRVSEDLQAFLQREAG